MMLAALTAVVRRADDDAGRRPHAQLPDGQPQLLRRPVARAAASGCPGRGARGVADDAHRLLSGDRAVGSGDPAEHHQACASRSVCTACT